MSTPSLVPPRAARRSFSTPGFLTALAVCGLTTALIRAQQEPKADEGIDGPLMARLKALDKNQDGQLTGKEVPPHLLPTLDLNGDGTITLTEIGFAFLGQGKVTAVQALASVADADGDGLITFEEAGKPGWFAWVDKNSDGQVDAAELSKSEKFIDRILRRARKKYETPASSNPNPVSRIESKPLRSSVSPLTPSESGVGRQIPDATFTPLSGPPVKLSQLTGKDGLVIAMTSATCPVSKKYTPALVRLSRAAEGPPVLFVNALPSETEAEITSQIQDFAITAPYTRDLDGALKTALRPATTTEVFVLDSTRTLVYRGALDDQYGIGHSHDSPTREFVKEAIAAMRESRAPEITATPAPGCELVLTAATAPKSTPADAAPVTYHRDIARILNTSCVSCHRSGGLAPFALTEYDQVRDRARVIARVVDEGVMPPWGAAPDPSGHNPWSNDPSLPETDKAALLAWCESTDKPAGDPKDAPVPVSFSSGDWRHGPPDLIVEIPREVTIRAEGKMPYVNFTVPTGLTKDKWIRGYEVRPTDIAVTHHVLAWHVPPGQNPEKAESADGFFAAYVPGNASRWYPEGFAKRLPANSSVRFQLHYTPNGKATADRTRIGLYFSDTPPVHEVHVGSLLNNHFQIPAGAGNHKVIATKRLPADIALLAFMPHMHIRGKSFRYEIFRLSGSETLLDVPRYDFNWQLTYLLKEPRILPKGTLVRAEAAFDNSTENPANPDPTKTVRWGPQSDDEMMIGYVEYYLPEAPVAAN